MSPAVHGRGKAPTEPPRARKWSDCAECGKPFEDREHRGVVTHMYRPGRSVDEMAREMLRQEVMPNPAGPGGASMPVALRADGRLCSGEEAVALISAGKAKAARWETTVHQRLSDSIPEERPRDPNVEGPVTGSKRQRSQQPPVVESRCCPSRPRRHRHRIPSNWWKRRCRCHECHRKPNYALIEAMERECRIRDESGALAWPAPEVGSHDQHGRTVVAVVDEMPVWDRPAPPAPPRSDPGQKQRV